VTGQRQAPVKTPAWRSGRSTVDDQPIVEVIEVRQVLQSADHHAGRWAVERWTAAESPPNFEADAEPGFESIPTNGLCYLFPRASFC